MIDRQALADLSRSSITRSELEAEWCGVAGSTCLQRYGYQVRVWWRFAGRRVLYEYLAPGEQVRGRPAGGWDGVDRGLPRVTADTYDRQATVHRALGLLVVPPGRPWVDHGEGQRGLWDGEVREVAAK